MIDYIEWAKEHEVQAQKVWNAMENLKKCCEKRLSHSERSSLQSRINHLNAIYKQHMAAAERLRERGASDNA